MYLTGGIRVEGPSGAFVAADLPGNQGRLALAALVLERRPLSRDQVAERLWDDRLPTSWRGALHTIISKLRALFADVGLDSRTTLTTVGSAYALRLPPDAWVDLEDALRRLDRAEGALRHGDVRTATAEATVASSILRRPFLVGIDGHWVERQRHRQAAAAYRCATVLAEGWLRLGDPPLAASIAESAIGLDPLREVGHRLLIRAELQRGDRAAALRAFTRCEQLLADELGAAPSPQTAHLVDRARRRRA